MSVGKKNPHSTICGINSVPTSKLLLVYLDLNNKESQRCISYFSVHMFGEESNLFGSFLKSLRQDLTVFTSQLYVLEEIVHGACYEALK